MKIFIFLLVLSASFTSFGAVVTSHDTKHSCVVYRATSEETPKLAEEGVVEPRNVYGFTMKDIQIDFDTKIVSVEITKRVVFAFDRPLLEERVYIKASNPNFKYLVNQLNRDLFTFEKVCVSSQNELIWATMSVQPAN